MPNPIIPLRGVPLSGTPPLRPSVGVPRAQNLNISQLQQKTDREQAAVSMNQVLSRKAGIENTRSTSVAHMGQAATGPTTSITHPGAVRSVNDMTAAGQSDSAADDRRYTYMRKMIKERQAKEAMAAKQAAASASSGGKSGLDLGKGSAFRKTGVGGIHKTLSKEFRAHRTTYGSLTSTEKKVLEDSLTGRLSNKTVSSKISRYDKKEIKKDINKAHDAGDVSFSHAKILKKVVDKLH